MDLQQQFLETFDKDMRAGIISCVGWKQHYPSAKGRRANHLGWRETQICTGNGMWEHIEKKDKMLEGLPPGQVRSSSWGNPECRAIVCHHDAIILLSGINECVIVERSNQRLNCSSLAHWAIVSSIILFQLTQFVNRLTQLYSMNHLLCVNQIMDYF